MSLALAALAVAACGTAASDPAGAAPGTLTYAVESDPACPDPQQAGSGVAVTIARQLADSLTDQDPATGKIVPWLASSWEVSRDATTFTFHLRSGVTFSDGSPLTAQSVKDNFGGIVTLGAKAVIGASFLAHYKDTVVLDPLTARVEFTQPSAQFLQASSTVSLGLLAESSLAKPAGARCSSGVIGSGPFTLDHYTPNQEVVENRRAGYHWGSSLWSSSGPTSLSKLVFKIVPEQSVRTGSLESGQLDAIGDVQPGQEANLTSAGFTLQSRQDPGIVYSLTANVSRPIDADPAVRQAIQKAVDRKQIVNTVLSPYFKPATSILATPTLDYTNLGADLTTDVAGAKTLLDQDGWLPGADGIRAKNGTRLALQLNWFNTWAPQQSVLELLQQQLKAVGIEVDLKEYSVAQGLEAFKAGDYDLTFGSTSSPDPDTLRNYYTTDGLDAARLPAGQLQTLLHAQSADGDPAQRAKDVAQAQRLIVGNAYAIPIFESTSTIAESAQVHGVRFDASSHPIFHDATVTAK
ncbi:MAG TPA: ABC transporter substrate-binding protein [Pseudonocardiaceae bacterium]